MPINLQTIKDLENVSEGTKRTYLSVSKKINGFIKKTKITNFNRIVKLINKNVDKNATKLSYYKVLSKYLQGINGDKEDIDKYRNMIMITNQEIEKEKPKKLEQVKEKLKDIDYNKIKQDFFKKIKDNDYKTTLLEFILSFYLLRPPRRADYYNMIYVESRKDIQEDKNYLVGKRNIKGKSGYGLVFQDFKSFKAFGKQSFMIDNETLTKIIDKKELKSGELIYGKSRRTYTRDINKITQQVFGKKLGINDLRKLHSTELFKGIKEDANAMGHSVGSKVNNYIF